MLLLEINFILSYLILSSYMLGTTVLQERSKDSDGMLRNESITRSWRGKEKWLWALWIKNVYTVTDDYSEMDGSSRRGCQEWSKL